MPEQAQTMMPLIIRRIINRVGRPLGINPFPRAFNYDHVPKNRAGAFEEIYQDNFWASDQSRSGVGSELEFTKRYRAELADLILCQNFKSMFDAPCGDLNWMPELLQKTPINYQGGDISESLVKQLKKQNPQINISQFDICNDPFPKVDVWHCRDCLFHLPFADILTALKNFVASEIPYALLTTHRAFLLHRNLDLNGIGFRFLDLERAPISLPKPLAYLPDYSRGSDFPRYVGLWSRQMIKDALSHKPTLYLLDASVAVTGAFVAARNMARAIKEDYNIVLVLPRGSAIAEEALQDFWRVEYLPIVNISKRFSACVLYFPALLLASLRLRLLMRGDGAQTLLLNDFYLMHGAVMRLLGFRGKIIAWVRCEPKNMAGFLSRPLLFFAKRSANKIVAVSKFVQSLLGDAEVIYDYYSGTAQAKPSPEKTFLYIGNYIAGKGQDVALQAFAIVAKHDTTVRLAFYGGDMGLQKNNDYRQKLEETAQQLGIKDRISFGDFLPDTSPVLECAFAALNFSNSESFSMTVLEASGAGLPVIATDSGGPKEIIKEGVTGYIIQVGDVVAAADRMLMLAQNPSAAATMGQAGASHISQTFSLEKFRNQLRDVIITMMIAN